jgi:hypothetical protein
MKKITAAQNDAMLKAITEIFVAEDISNEYGEQMVDFTSQGLDGLDFSRGIGRHTFQSMLQAAYLAGRASR